MKRIVCFTSVFIAAFCLFLFVQGCVQSGHNLPAGRTAADDHAALHQTKYNNVLVEFPGHRYSMEIIDVPETPGLVTAFLTDAHFNPIAVDATEVSLKFIVGGAPKTFTLIRMEQEAGKPAAFVLTDMELATLIGGGWQGEAVALVEISGRPNNAKLVKLNGHDSPGGHGH